MKTYTFMKYYRSLFLIILILALISLTGCKDYYISKEHIETWNAKKQKGALNRTRSEKNI